MLSRTVRNCIVYGRNGEVAVQSFSMSRTASDVRAPPADTSIAAIMNDASVCARPELEVASVVRLMIQHHVGCVPVVDEQRRPIGVVTKWDIVEQLDALLRGDEYESAALDMASHTASEVMMPLALTLNERATVADAAEMMRSEDTHHVLVVSDDGSLVGVVSSKDIATWLVTSGVVARSRGARGAAPVDLDNP